MGIKGELPFYRQCSVEENLLYSHMCPQLLFRGNEFYFVGTDFIS